MLTGGLQGVLFAAMVSRQKDDDTEHCILYMRQVVGVSVPVSKRIPYKSHRGYGHGSDLGTECNTDMDRGSALELGAVLFWPVSW